MSAPTYDNAGNMLTGNGRTYTYDPLGQVASVQQGGTTLTAEYASDGTVWKISAGGVTRYRIFDDFEWNQSLGIVRTSVFLDGQVIAISEEAFTPTSYPGCGQVWPKSVPQPAGGDVALALLYALAGGLAFPMARAIRWNRLRTGRAWVSLGTSAVFIVFVSVPPVVVVPEPASAAAPANTMFFHPDRLGSSLVVSNNTGAASAQRVVYRPFGALVQNSGGTSTVPERGFTGQRFESSVGVYDYNARWYDPGIAKFVQPDAVARVYDPQALGPYAYVANNPINRVDPSGNESLDCLSGACSFVTSWSYAGGGNVSLSFGFGGNLYRPSGFGFGGCINFVAGACSGPPGWFVWTRAQVDQAVRELGRIQAQASIVYRAIVDPIGTIQAILSPPVDLLAASPHGIRHFDFSSSGDSIGRALSIAGGGGQIYAAVGLGAACILTGGIACVLAPGLLLLGTNNLQEGVLGGDGWLRSLSQDAFGDRRGNLVYDVVDLGFSAGGAVKAIRKGDLARRQLSLDGATISAVWRLSAPVRAVFSKGRRTIQDASDEEEESP
jgi:RHS repeat-associated protein